MTGFFGKKKVRFSRTSTVHQPKTPQLVAGGFSPASSAGPLTPPDMLVGLPGPTPYNYYPAHSYQPPVAKYPSPPVGYYQGPPPAVPSSSNTSSPSRLSLHKYLEFSPRQPPLAYNLLDPPSMATRKGHHVSSSALAEPATSPPRHTLTIRSSHLPSSWEFTIVASNRSYVTVYDVLDQLYSQLRFNISRNDYGRWSSSDRERATTSYEHRYRRYRNQDAYLKEKAGGMKRVDFLMERTQFLGISRPARGEAYILNTG